MAAACGGLPGNTGDENVTREYIAKRLFEASRRKVGDPTWEMMRADGGYTTTLETWLAVADEVNQIMGERLKIEREARGVA